MVRPLFILIGGTLAAWAAVAGFLGEAAVSAASLAVAITLPPAVLTFLAVVRVTKRWPDAGPTVVMGGTLIRMLTAVVCVAILQDRAGGFGTTAAALTEWTTGFYILTLALETGLLWGLLSRPAEDSTHEPSAG